jgi:polyhydroxybutyrate depolymerase
VRRALLLLAACGGGGEAGEPTDAGVPDAACVVAAGDRDIRVVVDGIEHVFHVHVPAGLSGPAPVVLFFHGGGGDADGQEQSVGLLPFSDEHGFVLVRGEGWLVPSGFGRVWNAGACCGAGDDTGSGVDHVAAVDAFLGRLEAELCVDPRRVYATGHSNGGMFAFRLACELSGRIAAVAPNAAFLMNRDLDVEPAVELFACAPPRPVPTLQLHGMADTCAPFAGGSSSGLESATRPPVSYGLETLRAANGCEDTRSSITFENGAARCESWCAGTAKEVTLCTVEGAGHVWPGSSVYPPTTQQLCSGTTTEDLDANQTIWSFFQAHPMP